MRITGITTWFMRVLHIFTRLPDPPSALRILNWSSIEVWFEVSLACLQRRHSGTPYGDLPSRSSLNPKQQILNPPQTFRPKLQGLHPRT